MISAYPWPPSQHPSFPRSLAPTPPPAPRFESALKPPLRTVCDQTKD